MNVEFVANSKEIGLYNRHESRKMHCLTVSATLLFVFALLKPAALERSSCDRDRRSEGKSCEIDSSVSSAGVIMLRSIDFEVFGRVQGVFFRKHTVDKAKQLGLKGWVMNTRQNTVVGTAQGDNAALEEMKHWLSRVGSPQSRIDKCDFKNEKQISLLEFKEFSVKH